MTLLWPNHLLTLEEWEALPEDETLRLELAEGVLVMSPQPCSWHQKAAMRLGYRLDEQLPSLLTALTDVEVVLTQQPLTIRIPDVVVTRTARYESNAPRYSASEILLVVEVLSDGTRRIDRVLKFSEYAEAGIPRYWVVDLNSPVTLSSYLLIDGQYELADESSGSIISEVSGHPVTLDLDALIRR